MPRADAIGIVVSDVRRAVAFYGLLGLEFPEVPDGEVAGHIEAELPGGIRLMLDSEEVVRSFDPDWSPPDGGQRVAIAFLCDSPTDVDRVHGDLIDAGATDSNPPWDAPWGQRYAQITDPDGNAIDLFAPLAD
jgi:uncharacterized glyoxalase superfamily protein PhnB